MNKKPSTFKEDFQNFVDARALHLAGVRVMKDPGYKKYSNEASKLFYKIRKLLGDNRQLIADFESASALCESYTIEYVYKQGLKDGILLKQELGLDCAETLMS